MVAGGCFGMPSDEPTLRVYPMAGDINLAGHIFGGWIMGQIDIAGGVVAIRRAEGRVATVAAKIDFRSMVHFGDLVSLYASVVKAGKTSITVRVEAYTEPRSGLRGDCVLAASAELVYVALDDEGRKRELPPER
ncbi:MAG TPA: acyl-CoA thioesterase [Spirochaetales bacterium]|nr:acyl-CoA thioesterase [Spirochaetales bacterium]HRY55310.1 acyl-CoA thioesterase [Spirochaetia bacterium]HRZ64335.1 acyl-CoA thioesterase [Spirochaetia bacterium]